MNQSDQRNAKRSPIRVLVRCLPPGIKTPRRNGHETPGWEMWARNIADDGVGLRWSRQWAERRYLPDFKAMDQRPRRNTAIESPSSYLKKGQEICLDGLVYSEKGSQPMHGRIQWIRAAKKGTTVDFGIHITTPNHRSFFKALEA